MQQGGDGNGSIPEPQPGTGVQASPGGNGHSVPTTRKPVPVPKLLTPQLIEQFKTLLSTTPNRSQACRILRISRGSFHAWTSDGKALIKSGDTSSIQAQLVQALEEADATWTKARVDAVLEAAQPHTEETTYVERFPMVRKGELVLDEDGNQVMVEKVSRRQVNKAGDWKAAAWLLERLKQREFAPKQKLEHSGSMGLVDILTAMRDDEEPPQR